MARRYDRRSGRGGDRPVHPYPRTARVNALLLGIIATTIERMSDGDDRLSLLTVTAVRTDPDLRHATVLFASLDEAAAQALEERRAALQGEIGRGGRMKRTPTLTFGPDPTIAAGERVEEALRRLHNDDA
ncbi:MAG: ribosome-binding factor A [Acidimicrobiales bacterium]